MEDIPALIFVKDLQELFALSDPGSAARWMHRLARKGVPLFRLGKRLAMRREDFLAVLPQFEVPIRKHRKLPGAASATKGEKR